MSSVAPVPEAFKRLFLATDAPMGQTWLHSTRIQLTDLALHRQALAGKVPPPAKARNAYGHVRTASQMNKVPGKYWQPEPDLKASIQENSKLLNPQTMPSPMARLTSLSSEAVGGILLVTQQFLSDGTTTTPYITVVAAPSLATLGEVDANHPAGLSSSDYWDDTVLTPFALPADPNLHCPLMAAAEGASRKVKLPGSVDFMNDSHPLFFPYGELVAATVQLTTESHYQAFYLPEVCGMPLGLVWPPTIGFEDFLASIQSLQSAYQHLFKCWRRSSRHSSPGSKPLLMILFLS
jgi:hypothetical protein